MSEAPVRRNTRFKALSWLLSRRATLSQLGAQAGGLGLVLLVTLVEGGPLAQVPRAWAALSPVLALLGGAWMTAQLRRGGGTVALAAAGWSPRWVWLAAALAGGLSSAPAIHLLSDGPATLVRVDGGWWRGEEARPDAPEGAALIPVEVTLHPWRPVVGAAMAAAGAACGPVSHVLTAAGVVLVVDVVARGAAPDGHAPVEGAPVWLALLWLGVRDRAGRRSIGEG